MNCPSCGTDVADNAAFCMKCGARIRESNAAAQKRRIEVTPKKLGEWAGIGLVCLLLLWIVYIPVSIIWAYACPGLTDNELWTFRGSRANGVRSTGYILGEPRALYTIEKFGGLINDYYVNAWDEDYERYVAVRCDARTFRRFKEGQPFRLKGVVRTPHKDVAQFFKEHGESLSWKPTMVLPGKCIDMTGLSGLLSLGGALALIFFVPWSCLACHRLIERRRTARHCVHCGVRLEEDAKFCIACGTAAPVETPVESGMAEVDGDRDPEPQADAKSRWDRLPKSLQSLCVLSIVLGGLLIYFVFWKRYWNIEWVTLK